jgi:hypothetical protein
MQVSDSPAAPPAGPATKDEARAVGDDASSDRRRVGRTFRRALEGGRGGVAVLGNGDDVASAAAMAAWFRPESKGVPGGATAPARAGGVASAGAVDRVLIGAGPDGAEARIRIGAGALAGTELQLFSAAAGNTVEARLLTHAASSRQTLSVVLDEIRARLRERGIILSATADTARPRVRAHGDGGADDRPPGWRSGERAGAER